MKFYIANTHLKPVIGVDIHFVNVPTPFIPIPHPYIGLIFDVMDYIPFLGTTVKVNNVPRGNAETGGMIITFEHIPFGAGFTLMPMIGHDSVNFYGSKKAKIEGAPMSGAGYMVMTCNDVGMPLNASPGKRFKPTFHLYLPTSFSIPVTWGNPVKVGGPMGWYFNPLTLYTSYFTGCAFKLLGKGAGRLLKNLNKKVLKKSPRTQKLSKRLCRMGFEPVDLVTGRVNYEYTDFELPGPIPIKWLRNWDSDSKLQGPLGHGIQLCYDRCIQLWPEESCLSVTLEDGRLAVFPLLFHGEEYYHPQEKMVLRRKPNGHFVLDDYNNALYYHFNHEFDPGIWQLSYIENYSGDRVQLHYTGKYLAAMTDSVGRQLIFTLDDAFRITEVTVKHRAVEQVLISYGYGEKGDLESITDALGQTTTIEYRYHLMIKKTDRNGQSFYWEYDSKRRCIHTWGDGGILEGYIQYNKGYNTVTNSLGEEAQYYFDENNLCVQETDHYGNNVYTEYTADNHVYREIDELGNITGYIYNEKGMLKEQFQPDGSSVKYNYNDYNQLTLILNANGSTETYSYDDKRRLTSINYPNGKLAIYEYNEQGELYCIKETGGRQTVLSFDEDKNVTSLKMPDGSTTHWKYDALGRCIQSTNAAGETRHLEYDALNRVRSYRLPDGNKIKLEYNAYEQVVQASDRQGKVQYEYTPLGNVKKRRQGNTEIKFLYDTEERLRTIINEDNKYYRIDYDHCGDIISEIKFDGTELKFERDATGKITKMIRPGNRFTEYEYDAIGNISRIGYHDGTWELYNYDRNGFLKEAVNEHCTVRFTRDKNGLVITEQQDDYEVHSTYDKVGNRVRIHSNLGANITIARDKMDQATEVEAMQHQSAWKAQFHYNQVGQEIERLLPGGIVSQWTYDQAGRSSEHKVQKGGVMQSWKKYTWGANDQLTSIFDALAKNSTGFKYDNFGNLAFAQYADNRIVHRKADNIGAVYETPAKNDRTYSTAGALQECANYLYKYDEEGRLISKTDKSNHKKTRYVWYANGLLRKVLNPDGKTVEFTYDCVGRRISKRSEGKVTRWVWNRHVPLHEWTYNEADKPQALVNEWGEITYDKKEPTPLTQQSTTWVFDADGFAPCAKIEGGLTYSIITDHLGTPAAAYDENGRKVWECALDIYGRTRTIKGSKDFIPFRYQGQYEDVETGLYYNRFRYYDPHAGAYISQDPVGIAGGPNVYAYVHDTNTCVDTLGLSGTPVWDFATLKDLALNHLDFTTGKDEAVFWSSRRPGFNNMKVAQDWADLHGKKTVELTKGGSFLNDLKLFENNPGVHNLTGAEAAQIWDIASDKFSKAASGDVNVFSTYTSKYSSHGMRTWWRLELENLKSNPKVTSITRRRRDGSKAKNGHLIKCP